MGSSYLSPKARPTASSWRGHASVAVEPIAAGEVVAAFGGTVITRDEFDLLPTERQIRSIQIEERLYLAGAADPEPGDFVNHSCDPNLGLSGTTVLVALRDIAAGETLAYDYATSDGSDYDEFECECGTAPCRGKVTGADWMLPELQLAYRGHFSPYLARRISGLVSLGAERRAFTY